MTKFIIAKCQACGFEGSVDEFKVSIETDYEGGEEDFPTTIISGQTASLECPKCGLTNELKE